MSEGGLVITLAIVNKAPRAKGPGMVVRERGKGASGTLLLAVTEATTRRSAQACEQIASAIQGAKRNDSTALTTQLMAGIEDAHRALVGANGRTAGSEPVAAGVSCALIKGPQALLAQAGPGLAYWLNGEELTASAPDLSLAGPKSNALGLARKLHIHLNRCTLEPGATLLLATSPLAQLVTGGELQKLLAEELATAAQRLYRRVRELPNFAAILYRQGGP